MGADLEVGHTCSYFLDDSDTFVSQYSPRGNRRHVAFENVKIGSANRRGRDPDDGICSRLYPRFRLCSKARLPDLGMSALASTIRLFGPFSEAYERRLRLPRRAKPRHRTSQATVARKVVLFLEGIYRARNRHTILSHALMNTAYKV